MDSEIAFDYTPRFRIYKNGRIERLSTGTIVPPSPNSETSVVSKDAVYSPEKNLSLRIYLPKKTTKKKLPLLVYFHGGGFITGSAFSHAYDTFLTSAVSAAYCIAVSVEYRLAPEHTIPTAYEDSWDAIKWVFIHVTGSGQEDWVNENADFSRVFFAGHSSGANIAHHMGIRAGTEKLKISGIVLFHPYFWSKAPVDEKETRQESAMRYYEGLWEIASPDSEIGVNDPWINVVGSGSDISGLGCDRVLVMVAEKDVLVRQGIGYAAKLEKSGWVGRVEVMESKDETHVFNIINPDTDNARQVLQRFAEFLKDETS